MSDLWIAGALFLLWVFFGKEGFLRNLILLLLLGFALYWIGIFALLFAAFG